MEHLFTWGGSYFGYREGDDLWTYKGNHVGRFDGDEIYAPDGSYLGELVDDRLIRHRSKSGYRRGQFRRWAKRVGRVPFRSYVGYVMLVGYEDFAKPDQF